MKKLALGALFAGLTACGGGETNVMLIDAAMVDAMMVCNPVTQGGCDPGQMCTWIQDVERTATSAGIGHVGCVIAGTVALDGACMEGAAGPTGFDNCSPGNICMGDVAGDPGGQSTGKCHKICDPNAVVGAAAGLCQADHSCTRYSAFFESGGTTVAGVCDPACDPLTQDLKVGTAKTACGSTMPADPTKGCYGYDDFSCAGAGDLTLTDRTTPEGPPSGGYYLNGCAPGYIPLFFENGSGAMKVTCTGFCGALEIDNTAAHSGNGLGSTTALAKLPTGALPEAGNATCNATKKGSIGGGPQRCKFLYPSIADETTGEIAATFEPYLDTLGVCFSYTQFTYDNDMNPATPNIPLKDCTMLPPRSATTTMPDDDAADWDCQLLANSQFTASKLQRAPAMRDFHVGKPNTVPLKRHDFN